MSEEVRLWVSRLQKYGNRWWYAPVVSFLALIDHFIVIIPTDGLLISAVFCSPKRWIFIFSIVTLGSSLGALALSQLVEAYGLPFILDIVPNIDQSRTWIYTANLMEQWGGFALFLVSLSPFMQHPAVALAGLVQMPGLEVFLLVFAGRYLKYGLLAWLASHAPAKLEKLWGLKSELKEVNLEDLKNPTKPCESADKTDPSPPASIVL
ncbi:MAG: hypothetical protein M9962_00565 [Oligoflexia bacterium]|nr:hypothetical protein [Oligoflexia bacterium]